MKLAMAILVSVCAFSHAENNPDVFRSYHMQWSAQAGATSYRIHYQAAAYPIQQVQVGAALSADLNFLIPGLPYWFETYWLDAGGLEHAFGGRQYYTAPGAGQIGYQPGRVRYVVKPQQRTRLLASPDLKTWTVVADKVWTVDGVAEFFEPATTASRFYRTLDN